MGLLLWCVVPAFPVLQTQSRLRIFTLSPCSFSNADCWLLAGVTPSPLSSFSLLFQTLLRRFMTRPRKAFA